MTDTVPLLSDSIDSSNPAVISANMLGDAVNLHHIGEHGEQVYVNDEALDNYPDAVPAPKGMLAN
jgi:hypothetical protein